MSPQASSLRPEELLSHATWVRRLARSLVAGEDRAEDVAQETWLQALRAPPADRSNVRGWLTRVAQNVARKLARGEQRRERREAGSPPPSQLPSPEESLERATLQRRVVDAVLALDEIYRSALLLRFFEDLPPTAVASALGVPIETARTRIKRGLALLRERMGVELGGERHWAAGLVLGGAFMSKSVKVAAVVVAAGAALFGSYRVWIAPHLADAKLAKAPKEDGGGAAPMTGGGEEGPAPAPLAATREPVERATSKSPPTAAVLAAIEGKVVDSAGRAVAGATVVLDRTSSGLASDRRMFLAALRRYERASAENATWRSATSASDGSFRFDDVDPKSLWALGAMHDPLGTGWSDAVEFAPDPALARVMIALTPGVVLFGTVRDSVGQAVESASVMLGGAVEAPDATTDAFNADITDFANTAADGVYRSLPLPWRHVKMHVLAHGRPELAQLDLPWEELPSGVHEVRRDLTIPSLTILRGRILGPDGQPARLSQTVVPRLGEDARRTQSKGTIAVVALSGDPRSHPELLDRLGTNDPGLVTLDADHLYGKLLLAEDRYEIPMRSAELRFVAVVARDRLLGAAEIPTPPAAPDVVIDPGLVPERSLLHPLRLHFRDGRDGSPLSGVHVHATTITRGRDGQMGMEILNFGALENPPPDRDLELPLMPCTVEMHHDGFVAHSLALDPSRPGAASELTFDFLPAASGSLALHVTDEEGAPVVGAWFRVYRGADLEPVVRWDDQPTDEHGDCSLAGLPAGPCTVVVQKDGFVPAAAEASIGHEATPVELTLERGFEVTIQARLADGTPASTGQLAVLNEQGVALYDHFHPRAGPTRLFGRKLRLVDGNYTVRCSLPAIGEGTATFVATPGLEVAVRIEPFGR